MRNGPGVWSRFCNPLPFSSLLRTLLLRTGGAARDRVHAEVHSVFWRGVFFLFLRGPFSRWKRFKRRRSLIARISYGSGQNEAVCSPWETHVYMYSGGPRSGARSGGCGLNGHQTDPKPGWPSSPHGRVPGNSIRPVHRAQSAIGHSS